MDQPEIANPPTTESPFAESPLPKLSILHLMLWMLCSAIYMTLSRAILERQHDLPENYASIQRVLVVFQCALIGAVCSAAIVLVNSRIRHPSSMRLQPGHWLLLIEAGSMTIHFFVTILRIRIDHFAYSANSLFVLYGMIFLIEGVANAFAGYRSETSRWKFAFGAMAVQCVLYGLSIPLDVSPDVTSWYQLVLSAWVVVVSIFDLRGQQRRDWLHWTGVATYVASAGPVLLRMIWMRFFLT